MVQGTSSFASLSLATIGIISMFEGSEAVSLSMKKRSRVPKQHKLLSKRSTLAFNSSNKNAILKNNFKKLQKDLEQERIMNQLLQQKLHEEHEKHQDELFLIGLERQNDKERNQAETKNVNEQQMEQMKEQMAELKQEKKDLEEDLEDAEEHAHKLWKDCETKKIELQKALRDKQTAEFKQRKAEISLASMKHTYEKSRTENNENYLLLEKAKDEIVSLKKMKDQLTKELSKKETEAKYWKEQYEKERQRRLQPVLKTYSSGNRSTATSTESR